MSSTPGRWERTMRKAGDTDISGYDFFSFFFISFQYYWHFLWGITTLRCTEHCDNDMAMTTQQHATSRLPRYIQHDNFKLTRCRRRRADESVQWGKRAIQTYQGTMISFFSFHFVITDTFFEVLLLYAAPNTMTMTWRRRRLNNMPRHIYHDTSTSNTMSTTWDDDNGLLVYGMFV